MKNQHQLCLKLNFKKQSSKQPYFFFFFQTHGLTHHPAPDTDVLLAQHSLRLAAVGQRRVALLDRLLRVVVLAERSRDLGI